MRTTSYSLAVANGDLVQKGSGLSIVHGVEKLKQDLELWMTEQFGIDRFHPTMGSTLQDHIGGVINATTQSEVQSEVLRVLQNYQAVQHRGLQENPQLYSLSELLYSIDDIQVVLSYDTVLVTIKIRNAESTQASLVIAQSLL